jgi:hypothetical protein
MFFHRLNCQPFLIEVSSIYSYCPGAPMIGILMIEQETELSRIKQISSKKVRQKNKLFNKRKVKQNYKQENYIQNSATF